MVSNIPPKSTLSKGTGSARISAVNESTINKKTCKEIEV